jgi:hypothetical protein
MLPGSGFGGFIAVDGNVSSFGPSFISTTQPDDTDLRRTTRVRTTCGTEGAAINTAGLFASLPSEDISRNATWGATARSRRHP